jgi:hypothetical protein
LSGFRKTVYKSISQTQFYKSLSQPVALQIILSGPNQRILGKSMNLGEIIFFPFVSKKMKNRHSFAARSPKKQAAAWRFMHV